VELTHKYIKFVSVTLLQQMAYTKSGEKGSKAINFLLLCLLLSSTVSLFLLLSTPIKNPDPISVWDLPKHESTHDFYICLTNHKTISENFDFKHANQYYQLTEELKRRCYK